MTKFYRIKEICLIFGISVTALRAKIERGELPQLEHPHAINTRVAGYSEETYQKIVKSFVKQSETVQSC